MTTCLDDRALYALSDSEGTAEERDHLAGCDRCTARLRLLTRDLVLLGEALRPAPVGLVRLRGVGDEGRERTGRRRHRAAAYPGGPGAAAGVG